MPSSLTGTLHLPAPFCTHPVQFLASLITELLAVIRAPWSAAGAPPFLAPRYSPPAFLAAPNLYHALSHTFCSSSRQIAVWSRTKYRKLPRRAAPEDSLTADGMRRRSTIAQHRHSHGIRVSLASYPGLQRVEFKAWVRA